MSTAHELGILVAETERGLVPFRQALNQWANELLVWATGRAIGAQRARKLRRRGARVVRTGTTANGKARFHWIPGHRFTWEIAP